MSPQRQRPVVASVFSSFMTQLPRQWDRDSVSSYVSRLKPPTVCEKKYLRNLDGGMVFRKVQIGNRYENSSGNMCLRTAAGYLRKGTNQGFSLPLPRLPA